MSQPHQPSTFDARADLPAALVVFLVALPLCLGIALASDAPLVGGLISGAVGGILIGALSGSHTAVSGPAAGLAVIVASGIHELGSYEAFLAAGAVAGGLQLVLGALRTGWVASLFPSSVIRGMLAAIGIILILKQIPHALGRDADFEGDESFWMLNGESNTFTEIVRALVTMQPGVMIITAVSLAILWGWEQPAIKRLALTKVLPGPLVAVAMSVLINELYKVGAPDLVVLAAEGHLVQVPVLTGAAAATLPQPDWSALGNPAIWTVAVEIAVIASLETLLSLEATDRLDPFRRHSSANRELLAQGAGNAVSALAGGLPITAVIVRSSANIQAGARSRWSAILHGVLLVVMVLAAPTLLNLVPLASLAAVLLVVGYKLARVELFQEMMARAPTQYVPFLLTIGVTVVTDLLIGVSVGLAAGIVAVIMTDHKTAITVVNEGNHWLVRFTRDATFLNKNALRDALDRIPDGSEVVLDGARISFVDPDIADVLDAFCANCKWRNIQVTYRSFEGKIPAVAAAH